MVAPILFFILLVVVGCSSAPQLAPARPSIIDCKACCGFQGVDSANMEQDAAAATALNCKCK
jgi:hypothetical protein